jgi:alpha-amylase
MMIEKCRLSGLPDLDTENEKVKEILFKWIRENIIMKYNFDGVRIDAMKHVNKKFWTDLNFILKDLRTFSLGEVMHSQSGYVAEYQKCCADSLFNYPLYYSVVDVFVKKLPIRFLHETFLQ